LKSVTHGVSIQTTGGYIDETPLEPLDTQAGYELDMIRLEVHKFDAYLAAYPQSALRTLGVHAPASVTVRVCLENDKNSPTPGKFVKT
jgi:hypothetical protein